MLIRKYQKQDEKNVLLLIHETLQVSNINDYGQVEITRLIQNHNHEWIQKQLNDVHFYVAVFNHRIVGVLGIKKLNDKQSKLQTFFVDPKMQKMGIGSKLLDAIKFDDYYLTSTEIVLDASKTALNFYLNKGYCYVLSNEEDENGLYYLKKAI